MTRLRILPNLGLRACAFANAKFGLLFSWERIIA